MHETRFEQWSVRLCAVLAAALQEVASVFGDSHTFAALDLGCFPWHGSLELSLLTAEEFQADPDLNNVEEVASWQYHAINDDLESWRGAADLEQSMKAIRPGGQISMIGVLSGTATKLNLKPVLMSNLRIQGILVGSREGFEAMNRAIAQHQLRPVVDKVFAFSETPEAFEYMAAGRHFGKVCIAF